MTALPPLATVSALAAWVGQAIEPADPRAGAVLSGASALVRAFTGRTWVNDQDELDDVPDAVATIVVQAASRVWHNPSGAVSWTKGPFSERYSESAVAAGLYLTDTEKELLAEFQTGQSATGLGTITFTSGAPGRNTLYVPTAPAPSGYPFPWYAADDPALG